MWLCSGAAQLCWMRVAYPFCLRGVFCKAIMATRAGCPKLQVRVVMARAPTEARNGNVYRCRMFECFTES